MYIGNLLVYTKNKSEQDQDMKKVMSRLNNMMINLNKVQLTKEEQLAYNKLYETIYSKEFYYCASHPNIQIDWKKLNADYKRVDLEGMTNKFKTDINTLLPLILPKGKNVNNAISNKKEDDDLSYSDDAFEFEDEGK